MQIYFLLFLLVISNALKSSPVTGAEQVNRYLPFVSEKRVGLVVNQTSVIGQLHLVDSLLALGVNITTIFAPEHGFRGDHGAGIKVKSVKDEKTGLPIISLYGNHRKPTEEDMKDVDIILFDIQDVGARFYTYISTMHYVMEACAEKNIPFIVLDRPNPNGHYVDGPVLDTAYRSFVGMHPVPVVHGMTIGEYARMINGEGWLSGEINCELLVIDMLNYHHGKRYSVPVRPSPNLPNDRAIALYPSICFFEGTVVSLGRGTNSPFQVAGVPLAGMNDSSDFDTAFTPVPILGVAEDPPQKGKLCHGFSLAGVGDIMLDTICHPVLNLHYLYEFYSRAKDKDAFFNDFFDKLAGSKTLREQIRAGLRPGEIRRSWHKDLEAFKIIRRKYLLYPDFE